MDTPESFIMLFSPRKVITVRLFPLKEVKFSPDC